MTQRSGDVPVGVPANMIQYAALALMLEQLTGYRAVAYYHTISDAHIYADQVEAVRAMLGAEEHRLAGGLTRLHDMAEWGVKVYARPRVVAQPGRAVGAI